MENVWKCDDVTMSMESWRAFKRKGLDKIGYIKSTELKEWRCDVCNLVCKILRGEGHPSVSLRFPTIINFWAWQCCSLSFRCLTKPQVRWMLQQRNCSIPNWWNVVLQSSDAWTDTSRGHQRVVPKEPSCGILFLVPNIGYEYCKNI